MTIEEYLSALARLLPRIARLRALPEVRDHLCDAAARHRADGLSPFEAEAAATRDFGSVAEVGRRLGFELAVRETRLAALLALAAMAFFVVPLYVVPENTLPPAPWAEKPRDIALLQAGAIGCWLLGGLLATVGVALAWTRWSRVTAPALLGATAAVAASSVVSVALVVRWFALTPATPSWGFAAPLALGSIGACASAALWARASSRRLVPSG